MYVNPRCNRNNPDKFCVSALAANNNVELLVKQIQESKPKVVSVGTKELARKVQSSISNNTIVLFEQEGLHAGIWCNLFN